MIAPVAEAEVIQTNIEIEDKSIKKETLREKSTRKSNQRILRIYLI